MTIAVKIPYDSRNIAQALRADAQFLDYSETHSLPDEAPGIVPGASLVGPSPTDSRVKGRLRGRNAIARTPQFVVDLGTAPNA